MARASGDRRRATIDGSVPAGRAMKAQVFHDAVAATCVGRSWADAREEVAASLSLADAGEMLAETERLHHDSKAVVIGKLQALGAKGYLWGRDYEVRLEAWWHISPRIGICWCADAEASPDVCDWIAPDGPDLAVPEAERVQTLADDVTLVLTTGEGAMAFRTSRRVPCPERFL